MEKRAVAYFNKIGQNLSTWAKNAMENLSQDSRSPSKHSNQWPTRTKQESSALHRLQHIKSAQQKSVTHKSKPETWSLLW